MTGANFVKGLDEKEERAQPRMCAFHLTSGMLVAAAERHDYRAAAGSRKVGGRKSPAPRKKSMEEYK